MAERVAIFHFSAKVISRAAGSSAVAAAAYRSASRLADERLGREHDFSNKAGVVLSEVMTPEGAPERWSDRSTLWNEVESGELRKDAQLAREIEFALPRELDQPEGVRLAREFVQREFVDRGMVADLNVHWDVAEDGSPKPHAHVMLSLREVRDGGFGAKVREWNATSQLQGWRERWSGHVNARLAELGIDAAVDHRSFKDQAVLLEPQHKIGPAGARREGRGEEAERAEEHRHIARRNGERIIADPNVALDAITRQQSTFTDHDLLRFVHRHSDDPQQYARALSAVRTSPQLVALGRDGRGRERFSSREMLAIERRLEASGEALAQRQGRSVSVQTGAESAANAERAGLRLGQEQIDAVRHIAAPGDLKLVVGYAGTGKSAMLGVAREAWEAAGLTVRGAALSGIAADNLEGGSQIASRTLASLEHGWSRGRDVLTSRDVLVVDEAGMIGSRQMQRVLSAAQSAGAKVVLVGDPEQLQAIEAGAAFRALAQQHGAVEITQIRRQREDWQRKATRDLATGRTGAALEAYEAAGAVRRHATREEAQAAVVDGWNAARLADPTASQVILSHTRADVAELNRLARERVRASSELGPDVAMMTERGERTFAVGDWVMFLRNERSLGVKNGSLGQVREASPTRLLIGMDDGRSVGFELNDYAHIDHGYAATIHKAQGVTVDRAHVLATPGLDRHGAYVALSRHRDNVALHYGAEDFEGRTALVRTLGRERAKDTTLDYADAFAERRGIDVPSDLQRPKAITPPNRSAFARLKLTTPQVTRDPPERGSSGDRPDEALRLSVRDYARAWADAERMGAQGLPVLPHQRAALSQAREGLEGVSRSAAADLRSALSRAPGLAARGERDVVAAMAREGEIRRSPQLRAERFVEDWVQLQSRRRPLLGIDHASARAKLDGRMKSMLDGLGRDPQVEAILRSKRPELGLPTAAAPTRSLVVDLARVLTPGRRLGLGR